jgi:hypothetical protein
MTVLVKNQTFKLIAESLRPDEKNRISLTKVLAKLPGLKKKCSYHVYTNQIGQIVLQPMVEIPASEEWLHRNPKALASVRRGLAQADRGEARELGSFAKFTKKD